MKCSNCGTDNQDKMKFCQECGHILNKSANKQVCQECGRINRIGIRFCEECGSKLENRGKQNKVHMSRLKMVFAAILVLAVISIVVVTFIDQFGFKVTKNEAKNMAISIVQVNYPELSNLDPKATEYENEDGSRVISYSYIKQVDTPLDSGGTAQFTYGALVTVNQNTGEVQVITIR